MDSCSKMIGVILMLFVIDYNRQHVPFSSHTVMLRMLADPAAVRAFKLYNLKFLSKADFVKRIY